jgi:hypothetical protein
MLEKNEKTDIRHLTSSIYAASGGNLMGIHSQRLSARKRLRVGALEETFKSAGINEMAELFADFEVNKSPRWQRLLRLTSISFVLHVIFFAAIIYVPVLRAAFHIADKFSGAEYVDEDYEKINISDAVMLDAGGRFQYPPGYFDDQLANQDAKVIEEAKAIPTPKPMPVPTPVPTPKPSPSPSPTPQPTASPSTDADGTVASDNKLTPEEQEADKNLDKIAEQHKVRRPKTINKRPFVDLLVKYNELKEKGEIDLNKPVEMTIEADRNDDGTLRNVVVTRKSGDPKLIEATKDFVAALSASGALDFLEGAGHLTLNLKLDDAAVSVSASTEVASPDDAKQMAGGYNLLLAGGAIAKKGRDEATIMRNTSVTYKGKVITLSFNLARSAITEMLKKQIPAS